MKQSTLKLSSLSHKTILALAGLFLMLFLCTHLVTNLLMLTGDSAAFDKAVAFLSNNPLIKVIEYILFAGFIIHILFGVLVWLANNKARPVKYYVATNSETSYFSKFMIHTGLIIFAFLVIHLVNFYFVKLGLVAVPEYASGSHDFYAMAVVLFKDPLYSLIYIVCFVFLGFHLKHAFQSAFQTLGLNHNKYFPVIKVIGTIYALVISIGFSIIPIYFLFFH
jgi:succinate dehydrogenase / fumarate reductase, cytochrome b subunit